MPASTDYFLCAPDAMRRTAHLAVCRFAEPGPCSEPATASVGARPRFQRRTTPLRCVLRRARGTDAELISRIWSHSSSRCSNQL
jgi:hypothetical protein